MKRKFLVGLLFLLCVIVLPQEQPYFSRSDGETPSQKLRDIALNLDALEASETLSLQQLEDLKQKINELETSLLTSETELSGYRTQVEDAYKRYETLLLKYEQSQKQLKSWKTGFWSMSASTAGLLMTLILILCL